MTATAAQSDSPWIVWINYGLEGWSPRGFNSEAEALVFIESGSVGAEVCLTRRRLLMSEDQPEPEACE